MEQPSRNHDTMSEVDTQKGKYARSKYIALSDWEFGKY